MDRIEKAVQNFKDGYNCSQSVVAAYADLFDVSMEDALRMSEPFGGGVGRMRRTCGAVTGMFMLAGLKYSKAQAGDLQTRKKVYETVQQMNKMFEERNGGTSICAELLGLQLPKDNGAEPAPRTEKFYKKRPCIGCIEECARITEELLLREE